MPTPYNVRITATNSTNRAFDKIDRNVRKVTGNLLSAKGAFAGFIGVAGVAKLGDVTKDTIEFADAIAKTADKLGISTDALQEYRFAAERSGVESNALDVGIQRFTRRLGEAASGTGVLNGILEEYNIQVRDAEGNTRSTEDVLKDYADAIKNADDEQQQLLLAFKAFDTEGAALVNMLRNGSQGLGELQQSARDAGVVMDEQLIRKAEIMNDRWDTLTDTIGTKFKSALISVVDVFIDTRTETEILNHQMTVLAREMDQVANSGLDTWMQRTFGTTNQEQMDVIAGKMSLIAQRLNEIDAAKAAREEAADSGSVPGVMGWTDEDFDREFAAAEAQFERLDELDRQQTQAQLARGEAAFSQMLGAAAAHNETFFKIQKIYELSKLAMKAPAAIADSYAWGASWGGPPAGTAMAVIAGAAMASYASQLASAQYGGGSTSASTSSVSTDVSTDQPVTSVAPSQPEQSGGSLQVIFQGPFIGTQEFLYEQVLPGITEAIEDKDYIIISDGSRQSEELKA